VEKELPGFNSIGQLPRFLKTIRTWSHRCVQETAHSCRAEGLKVRNDVSDYSHVHIMKEVKELPKAAADPSWNEKLE